MPSRLVLVDLIDAATNVTSNIPHGTSTSSVVEKREWSSWLPASVKSKLPAAPSVAESSTIPTIAPLAEYEWQPRGGRYPGSVRSSLRSSSSRIQLTIWVYPLQPNPNYRVHLRDFANGTHIPNGHVRANHSLREVS